MTTSAPRSPRSCVPNGPATARPRSSTRMPSSGAPSERSVGARCPRRAPGAASARTSSVCSPTRGAGPRDAGGCRRQPVGDPDLVDRAELGIVDDRDAAVFDQRGIGERGFRRADRLHGDADLFRQPHPIVGGELPVRVGEHRVVVVQDDDLLRIRGDASGVVTRCPRVVGDPKLVALRRAERERRVRHPLAHPLPVGALEEAACRARVEDPRVVARCFRVLGALPPTPRRDQHALEQRRLDPLPAAR